MYKDGQLREAQTWIARVQEMDAFQLTANHSLQAELRERTDQYNQLWLGCQRQVDVSSSDNTLSSNLFAFSYLFMLIV